MSDITIPKLISATQDELDIMIEARADARVLNDERRERWAQRRIDQKTEELRELRAAQADEERLTAEADASAITDEVRQRRAAELARVHGSTDSNDSKWVRSNDGRPATVNRDKGFAAHPVVAQHMSQQHEREQAVIGAHGSFGSLVRSMTTTSGSAIVPTVWAADVIDRARNYAAVLQAGAEVVPMDAKTVQIGRLTADPTAAFRTEGSTITASDPTFDAVTLTATTMSALVVGSLEWFQDADNVDQVVSDAVARAIGLQLDLAALYGSITSGAGSINLATPPNPRGVLGTLNAVATSSVLGAAANGTAQTSTSYWNEILDTLFTPSDYNEKANGLIWNSKAARQYAKAYDTTGQPLAIPADVAAVPRYISNQIPSYTQGTMTSRATDVFAGDWTQLLIGQRLGLTVQTLTERYAENGQIGIVAHWRGDVQLARPRAFSVYKCIQGAV
jgi:HK97 family phage major capsid protein